MKNEDFLDLVGKIDDEFIEKANQLRKKKNKKSVWMKAVAIAACICLIVTGTFILGTDNAFSYNVRNYISNSTNIGHKDDKESYPAVFDGSENENDANPLESEITETSSTPVYYQLLTEDYKNFAISPAVYPDRPKYVDMYAGDGTVLDSELDKLIEEWFDSKSEVSALADKVTNSVNEFTKKTAKEFISTNNEEGNFIYSPLNVYFALSVLAETTGGNTQKQILDLLGTESTESLRKEVNNLWNLNYCDDGYTTSVLANSIWLNKDIKFNKSTLDNLADNYYASSFSGDVTDSEYSKAFQSWLNSQTGGLLKDSVKDLKFDEGTAMTLASTIYYKVRWIEKFSEEDTKKDTFYKSYSSEIQCDFMNSSDYGRYYWGDNFSCVSKMFTDDGSMKFILPNDGVSVNDLLSDNEVMDIISSEKMPKNNDYANINFSVPKFNISSNFELDENLKNLGIKDVFDGNKADFSNLTEENGNDFFVSNINHAGRVKIDEEGCEGAAYTVVPGAMGGDFPDLEIDFVLNRPFIFVITGEGGQTLFVGVVNNP